MRLEQGAHSCIQRAIDAHGAFAILYGRHSKHYIKKPEVFEPVLALPTCHLRDFFHCFLFKNLKA